MLVIPWLDTVMFFNLRSLLFTIVSDGIIDPSSLVFVKVSTPLFIKLFPNLTVNDAISNEILLSSEITSSYDASKLLIALIILLFFVATLIASCKLLKYVTPFDSIFTTALEIVSVRYNFCKLFSK